MCGIHCSISPNSFHQLSASTTQLISQRGPDGVENYSVSAGSSHFKLSFTASVLALRGSSVVQQPLIDQTSGSCLCWNGEAWKFESGIVEGNDTSAVFSRLLQASHDSRDPEGAVIQALNGIRGPFAFVFYDARAQSLYFGRDCLGRRSLVSSESQDGLMICSVSDPELSQTWKEVDADGVTIIDFSSCISESGAILHKRHVPFEFSDRAKLTWSLVRALIKLENVLNYCFNRLQRYPYGTLNTSPPQDTVPDLTVSSEPLLQLEALLLDAVSLRVTRIQSNTDKSVGVLFSGGLDSTLLAYLCHKCLPSETPIDLLNVAFHNPRIHSSDENDPYSLCPDRKTGISSYQTLREMCPGRVIRLVCINIPFEETCSHRPTIAALMHPHNTEMDLSIASALYFASRGQGFLFQNGQQLTECYSTPCRVLISGLGADELFGGYSRHALAFTRNGFQGLIGELDLDFNRLGKRNLGRDDRVTSHWGREVRYPFLDEDVIQWAMLAPVWHKCGFGYAQSSQIPRSTSDMCLEPGKLILRLLARKHGMHGVAGEKKRAVSNCMAFLSLG